jgi:hypothetical protein
LKVITSLKRKLRKRRLLSGYGAFEKELSSPDEQSSFGSLFSTTKLPRIEIDSGYAAERGWASEFPSSLGLCGCLDSQDNPANDTKRKIAA